MKKKRKTIVMRIEGMATQYAQQQVPKLKSPQDELRWVMAFAGKLKELAEKELRVTQKPHPVKKT